MNTADRSIAIVDVAIRRRFAFLSAWPDKRVVDKLGGTKMRSAFSKLLDIFVDYAGDDSFQLLPGHSYFRGDDEQAQQRLQTELGPLLEEYLAQGYVGSFAEPIRAYLQWLIAQ